MSLMIMPFLSACDFRPAHKVIEYQEEVKLSDGSFIWVDIKRHYRLAGEPFQKANYLTNGIEMTWDTGFPKVGKYTIKSNAANSSAIYTLDKHNNIWYVAMTVNRSSDFYKYNNGNAIRNSIMIYALNQDGHFIKVKDIPILYRNILSYKIEDTRFVHKNPAKFTWQEKIGQFNNSGLAVGNELYPNPVYSK